MKIQLVSDLHMEFAPIEITNAGADILVLSGDICIAEYFKRKQPSPYYDKALEWLSWFERTCSQFEHVFYILGNHEHYKGCFYETRDILKYALEGIENLTILDNDIAYYREFGIFGGTLWTDFDNDGLKADAVKNGLNDYRLIEGKNYRKLTTSETAFQHKQALSRIHAASLIYDRILVFGHHAPSYNSITPEYAIGPYAHLNPGYASRCDKFIEEHLQIQLWTHGHVHSSHDYMIGNTRIVANPRGYARKNGTPENSSFNPNLILEV